jgi:GTPase SAR1 family protein
LSEVHTYGPSNIRCVLVGNKTDLEGKRQVTQEEASRFAKENGLMFYECSAKSGIGVELVKYPPQASTYASASVAVP